MNVAKKDLAGFSQQISLVRSVYAYTFKQGEIDSKNKKNVLLMDVLVNCSLVGIERYDYNANV